MALKVIDVSEHQGTIDWNTVKGNIDGVILRCGYGDNITSQDDSQWKRNADECTRLGIPFGVYLYSYATTEAQARSEAEHVLRCISGYNLSYPVYLDLEEPGTQNGAISRANIFGDIIEAAGYSCGVYANTNWWTNYLVGLERFTKWVAQYNSVCTYTGTYDMWQYTSSGYVPGISGAVDMNHCYKNFGQTETSAGWVLDSNGWWYRNADGSYPASEWKVISGEWYYFNDKGYALASQWIYEDGHWYYLQDNCVMARGWVQIEKEWYYCRPENDGNPQGSMVSGWKYINGYWYYLNPQTDANGTHGAALRGLQSIDGYWYYFRQGGSESPECSMLTGWINYAGGWRYFNPGLNCQPVGSMMMNHWVEDGSRKYYLKDDGVMAASETLTISGKEYTFNGSGELI